MIKATSKKTIRFIAKAMVTLMVLPHLLLAVTATVVMAQTENTKYVAVLDFANLSKYGNATLSRQATDAVVVEMTTNTNKFSVVRREDLQKAMTDLDLTPPLDLTGVVRLAQKLAVNAVVVGEITNVNIVNKPFRQAQVQLSVRMLDAQTGEPMNGAIAQGKSTPRSGFVDDDVLITEAINNAAYLAVRTMVNYVIPGATVLNAVGDNGVLLNKGAQDGIEKGMEMLVYRNGQYVGKIRIVEVSNNDSQATVISAVQGVKPEDTARAIFKLPARVSASYGQPASTITGGIMTGPKKSSGLSQVLPWLGGLAILALLIGAGHKSNGESVGPSVAAEAGAPPTLNTADGGPGVMVLLDANRYHANSLLQWKIWRDDQPLAPVLTAGPGVPYVIDSDQVGVTLRPVSYLVTTPATPTTAPTAATGTVPGVTPGVTYTYRASAVIKVIASLTGSTSSTGGTTGGTTTGPAYNYEETTQQVIGRVTPLTRITRANMTSPSLNASVDLTNVSFSWNSTLGADTYVVEASLDPSFRTVAWNNYASPVRWSPASSNEAVTLANQNISAAFPNVTANTIIYWRVGAVNSADFPGPIPDPYTGRRYIYSEVGQFKPNEAPPPPP